MNASPLQILILSCTALLGGGGCAHAPERSAAVTAAPAAAIAQPSPHAQLEAIFWTCDYLATTRGLDATPITACTAATRELRQMKFDGSFNRMLAWWRENKPAEHGRIRRERNDPVL
jgi:hypothetical protein